MNKSAVLNKLDEIAHLIEKCGGPGGTMGPCPAGGAGDAGGKVGKKPSKKPAKDEPAEPVSDKEFSKYKYFMDSIDDRTPGGKALMEYRMGEFGNINRALRGISGHEKFTALANDAKDEFHRIAEPLKKNSLLFRGMQIDDETLNTKFKVGGNFLNEGFTSTTIDKSLLSDRTYGRNAHIEIEVPAGTPVVKMSNKYSSEKEMLLGPSSNFTIKSVVKQDDIYHIQMVLNASTNTEKSMPGLIEKCGGPGGTPGPCASGTKPKPAGKTKPGATTKPSKKPPKLPPKDPKKPAAGKPKPTTDASPTMLQKMFKIGVLAFNKSSQKVNGLMKKIAKEIDNEFKITPMVGQLKSTLKKVGQLKSKLDKAVADIQKQVHTKLDSITAKLQKAKTAEKLGPENLVHSGLLEVQKNTDRMNQIAKMLENILTKVGGNNGT